MNTEHTGPPIGPGEPPAGPDEELQSLIALGALDALEPEEREQLDARLASCPQARDLEASLRETAAGLSEGLEAPAPPALRDRVLAAVRDEASEDAPEQAPEPAARPRRRALLGGGLALAASALIGTGLVLTRPWRSQEQKEMDAVLASDDATTSTASWGAAHVTLVHSSAHGASVLEVTDLRAAGSGHDYQVWDLEGGRAASAGLLRPDDDGRARMLLSSPGADGTAITLEPQGGSAQPTSDVLVALDPG